MGHPLLEGSQLGAAGRSSSQRGLGKGTGCIEGFHLPAAASGPHHYKVGADDDSHGELQEDSSTPAARCLTHPVQCDQYLPAFGQQQGRQDGQDIPPNILSSLALDGPAKMAASVYQGPCHPSLIIQQPPPDSVCHLGGQVAPERAAWTQDKYLQVEGG